MAAPLVILIVAMFPARLGFAFGARPWLGADALWWAFPAGSIVSVSLTFAWYRWGNWRAARMLG